MHHRNRGSSSSTKHRLSRRNAIFLLGCHFLLSTSTSSNKRSIFGPVVHTVEAADNRRQNGGGQRRQGNNNNNNNQWGHQQPGGQQHQQKQNGDPNNYYGVLKLPQKADAKEIKSAYRKLALKFHPDKFKEDPGLTEAQNEKRRSAHGDKFVKVSAAYDVLSDDKKRNAYDKYGQNGLDMLEKGIDPEQAGFGGGGFGGFPGGAGGFPGGFPGGAGGFPGGAGGFPGGAGGFGGADASKMFEQMFGGSGGGGTQRRGSRRGGGGGGGGEFPGMGGGGFPGGMGGGFPGGGMGGFEQMFAGMGDMGGMGGIPGMGGMGGQQQRGGGGHQKNRAGGQQQRPQPTPAYTKDDPSGVVPLGKSKFPDSRAKHAWLMLFYDGASVQEDETQSRYVALAKQISEGVLKKAKNAKNGMIFKVGAVDCSASEDALKFCKSKLGKGGSIPTFATVLNGSVKVVEDKEVLRSAKKLHDHMTDAIVKVDGLVVNVNSVQHIQSRLFTSSATPGHPAIAIMLLTDKYETSPLYASLAYRHRQDGFVAFGESRGSNLQLSKQFSVKKFPALVALLGSEKKTVQYDGPLDSESLSKWVTGLSKEYFKSSSRTDSNRKKQRARA